MWKLAFRLNFDNKHIYSFIYQYRKRTVMRMLYFFFLSRPIDNSPQPRDRPQKLSTTFSKNRQKKGTSKSPSWPLLIRIDIDIVCNITLSSSLFRSIAHTHAHAHRKNNTFSTVKCTCLLFD